MLLETVEQSPPKLARSQPDLYAAPEQANRTAGRRPCRCNPPPAHGRLTVRIPQRPSALSGSDVSFGSQDRQAKPLLQYVGVDALVIALLGDGASEEHDALRREGDKNTSTALTGWPSPVSPRASGRYAGQTVLARELNGGGCDEGGRACGIRKLAPPAFETRAHSVGRRESGSVVVPGR